MAEIEAEAIITAAAIIRATAEGREGFDPAELTTGYLVRVWEAAGRPESMSATEAAGTLIGALATVGASAVRALLAISTGRPVAQMDPAELAGKLDAVELMFLEESPGFVPLRKRCAGGPEEHDWPSGRDWRQMYPGKSETCQRAGCGVSRSRGADAAEGVRYHYPEI